MIGTISDSCWNRNKICRDRYLHLFLQEQYRRKGNKCINPIKLFKFSIHFVPCPPRTNLKLTIIIPIIEMALATSIPIILLFIVAL